MAKRKLEIDVPGWARGIVWYQIMSERFRNGDPNNTPRAIDQKNAWPHDHKSPLERHPWGSDWYRLQPYEQENGKNLWLNLQRRRYGGDLQGIIDQLDYLQDLGIGALYLNPVFEAPSAHKYDGATYHHVDPNFGPDPDGDRAIIARETPHDPSTWEWTSADEQLLMLIEEVHRRGMYIVLDGVFNHMGLNSWVYQDVLVRQQDSPFRDWIAVESWADDDKGADWGADERRRGEPAHPFRSGFNVRTWEGFNELPELREDRRGIVEGPREYIFEITRRWMDPYGNGDTFSGIDGWRLDVAFCVKHPFWKAWRKHVRSINPDAYLVGEVIDTIDKTFPYVKGDEFDAVMNYNFQFACNEFFVWTQSPVTATEFGGKLEELLTGFPWPVPEVMQNLLGSHDTDRLASRIVNRDLGGGRRWWDYFNRSRAENGKFDTRKPDAQERTVQRLMALVQFTFPGAPMIYYGDEAGMWGANDPCCRKPMLWPDYKYEPEAVLPDGSPRKEYDTVEFDRDLHAFYRRLIHLRNGSEAIRYGDFSVLSADDENGVFAFRRRSGEKEAVVIVRNMELSGGKTARAVRSGRPSFGEDAVSVSVSAEHPEKYLKKLEVSAGETGISQHQSASGKLTLEMPPGSGVVLVKE